MGQGSTGDILPKQVTENNADGQTTASTLRLAALKDPPTARELNSVFGPSPGLRASTFELAFGDTKGSGSDVAPKPNHPTPLHHYEKNGKQIPIYSHNDTVPFKGQRFDPETNVLKESFHQPFGVKDPTKPYGGVLIGTDTSRRIVRREEVVGQNGKTSKVIEIDRMEGFDGFGKALGIAGDRKLVSVKMRQENGKSFKQATIIDKRTIFSKSEPIEQAEEPMLNEEFDRRYAELHPDLLKTLVADRHNPQRTSIEIAKTERRSKSKMD